MNELLIEKYVKNLENVGDYMLVGYHHVPNEIKDYLHGPVTMKHKKYFAQIAFLLNKYNTTFNIHKSDVLTLPNVDEIITEYSTDINLTQQELEKYLNFFTVINLNITFMVKYNSEIKKDTDYEVQLLYSGSSQIIYDENRCYDLKPKVNECDNTRYIIYNKYPDSVILTDYHSTVGEIKI